MCGLHIKNICSYFKQNARRSTKGYLSRYLNNTMMPVHCSFQASKREADVNGYQCLLGFSRDECEPESS